MKALLGKIPLAQNIDEIGKEVQEINISVDKMKLKLTERNGELQIRTLETVIIIPRSTNIVAIKQEACCTDYPEE